MAKEDWTYLNDGLDWHVLARGATAGISPPPGGGSFAYAFNSLASVTGAVGLFVKLDTFAPMEKGGSIRGCIQRGPGGGPTGFSPFLFLCAQGDSVNDTAYLLGLSDEDPHRIVLRKGSMAVGIPDSDGQDTLLVSGESYTQGSWLQIRLDAVVNGNGDVVLRAMMSDLEGHNAGAPNWVAIPGMEEFIDDAVSISSGSAPLTSGRAGFGMAVKDVTRRAYFDQIEVMRQV